jgi:hypothetical protein
LGPLKTGGSRYQNRPISIWGLSLGYLHKINR